MLGIRRRVQILRGVYVSGPLYNTQMHLTPGTRCHDQAFGGYDVHLLRVMKVGSVGGLAVS